jgi:hypothetical protein
MARELNPPSTIKNVLLANNSRFATAFTTGAPISLMILIAFIHKGGSAALARTRSTISMASWRPR